MLRSLPDVHSEHGFGCWRKFTHPRMQATSSPRRPSLAASAATAWATFTRNGRASRVASPARRARKDSSEFSAQQTKARASARKVRFLPSVCGGFACACICARRFRRALPPQGTTTRDSRPARFVALAIDRFCALPAMSTRLAFGFAGVCEMYEGARACAGCVAVCRTHSACLVWSRPCAREQVQSAFHVLAG